MVIIGFILGILYTKNYYNLIFRISFIIHIYIVFIYRYEKDNIFIFHLD
jgi:hypothetical protein